MYVKNVYKRDFKIPSIEPTMSYTYIFTNDPVDKL